MANLQVSGGELEKKACYLLSIACLVKDAEKHDELLQKASALLAQAQGCNSSASPPQ
jgi:hypothetical protein